jgi:hypothetical protein
MKKNKKLEIIKDEELAKLVIQDLDKIIEQLNYAEEGRLDLDDIIVSLIEDEATIKNIFSNCFKKAWD